MSTRATFASGTLPVVEPVVAGPEDIGPAGFVGVGVVAGLGCAATVAALIAAKKAIAAIARMIFIWLFKTPYDLERQAECNSLVVQAAGLVCLLVNRVRLNQR